MTIQQNIEDALNAVRGVEDQAEVRLTALWQVCDAVRSLCTAIQTLEKELQESKNYLWKNTNT